MRIALATGLLVSLLALSDSSAARRPLLRERPALSGETAGDQFGVSLASGDLDRDGRPEIIVGARDTDPDGVTDAGSVYVYSGRTGRLVRRLDGLVPYGVFGYSVFCSDVNRDGRDDVLVGAPNQGRVFVYSGRDFRLLHQLERQPGTFQMGYSLACADVNGDRFPDIVTGAPNVGVAEDGTGSVLVFSGRDGSRLLRIDGSESGEQFGHAVAAADTDRDGRADILVGAPLADPEAGPDGGSGYLFSGRDGSLIRRFDAASPLQHFASGVALADFDRDRRADAVISSPLADPEGRTDAGSVFVHSGRTGALIRRFDGHAVGNHMGQTVACVPLDGDRVPEVVVGGIQGTVPVKAESERVWIFSGRTGKRLQLLEVPALGDLYGMTLAGLRAPGRAASGILVGARLGDPEGREDAGRVQLYLKR